MPKSSEFKDAFFLKSLSFSHLIFPNQGDHTRELREPSLMPMPAHALTIPQLNFIVNRDMCPKMEDLALKNPGI